MNICPNCGKDLSRKESEFGVYWGCESCGGYAVSMAILRKALRNDCVLEAWASSRQGGVAGRNCPMCEHPMTEVPLTVDGNSLKLDVCRICQFFWFDPKELESLPQAPPPVPTRESLLPQAAREALAIQE